MPTRSTPIPTAYGTAVNDPTKPNALGQSGSLTNQSNYIPVSRVVAVIGADGSVDTSTRLYNVYNGNNPRSVYSVDGKSFYTSGQGISGDQTGGVFYATKGSYSATMITGPRQCRRDAGHALRHGLTTISSTSPPTPNRAAARSAIIIGTLGQRRRAADGRRQRRQGPGAAPRLRQQQRHRQADAHRSDRPTASTHAGNEINISPESFFFANATTLYVADSGMPKNTSADSTARLR